MEPWPGRPPPSTARSSTVSKRAQLQAQHGIQTLPPDPLSDMRSHILEFLVLNFTTIRIRNETLCLRFHFQALSACGTCSLGFSSAAIFDGMQ
ncbi:hypothetical protein F2P81_001526 [Scophthalmus maximus]|uniref:Uncharacterized protein n=1 Tax=Scophthalmus maximus TaxID=52904 RepID=A0A6A4TEG9_SCOMX|nr:hypothetical protein F2P81_001526 [Scophthalmus maximus]